MSLVSANAGHQILVCPKKECKFKRILAFTKENCKLGFCDQDRILPIVSGIRFRES